MASSFTLTSNSYDGRYLQLTCTQTKNIAANTSTIKWTLTSTGGDDSFYSTGPTTVKIAGTQVYYKARTGWTSEEFPAAKGSKSGTITVNHNSAGAASIAVSLSTAIYTGTVTTKSGTWTLDSIPRAASITKAPDITDGVNPTITYANPAGSAVTLIACISLTGAEDDVSAYSKNSPSPTGTSYTFNLSTDEWNVLRKNTLSGSTSRTVYFFLKTFYADGSSDLKSWPVTYTVTDCVPTLTADVYDDKNVALTGDKTKLIKYVSKPYIQIEGTAKKGASIITKRVTCGNQTFTTTGYTSQAISSGSFNFYVKDNRGQSVSKDLTRALINYIPLTCWESVDTELTGDEDTKTCNINLTATGNYFNGNFGATFNSLKVQYRYATNGTYGDWVDMSITSPTTTTYRATATITGVNYESTIWVEIRAVDKVKTVYANGGKGIPAKAKPVFDWSDEDFNFNVPVHVKGGITNEIPVVQSNVDTMLTSGRYYLGTQATNRPVNENGWLDVQNYGDGNYCYQIFVTYTGKKYERWKKDGIWEVWRAYINNTIVTEFGFGGVSGYATFIRRGRITHLTLCAGYITTYTKEASGVLLGIPTGFTPASAQVTGDMTTHALWSRGSHRPSIVGGLSIYDTSTIRIYYDFTSNMGPGWTLAADMVWANA